MNANTAKSRKSIATGIATGALSTKNNQAATGTAAEKDKKGGPGASISNFTQQVEE